MNVLDLYQHDGHEAKREASTGGGTWGGSCPGCGEGRLCSLEVVAGKPAECPFLPRVSLEGPDGSPSAGGRPAGLGGLAWSQMIARSIDNRAHLGGIGG
jgi:hypothetical protein